MMYQANLLHGFVGNVCPFLLLESLRFASSSVALGFVIGLKMPF